MFMLGALSSKDVNLCSVIVLMLLLANNQFWNDDLKNIAILQSILSIETWIM